MGILKIARYLIYLANNDKDYSITPLKLQKLLYYAQGFTFAWDGQALFNEEFEAWKYGPVNREVYDEFKNYGNATLPTEASSGIRENDLSSLEKENIEIVWEDLKKFDAFDLVEKTHNEDPWINHYGEIDYRISNNEIKEYFTSKN